MPYKDPADKKANRERYKERYNARRRERYAIDAAFRAKARVNGKTQYERGYATGKRDAYELMKRYGITTEQYNAMVDAQGGVCAICGTPPQRRGNGGRRGDRRLHVDHDHDTDEVRGLLCTMCNTALGLLGDDPERLASAVRYLERWTRSHSNQS